MFIIQIDKWETESFNMNLNIANDEEEGLEEEIWASVFTAVQTQKEFSCRLDSQGTFIFQVTVI